MSQQSSNTETLILNQVSRNELVFEIPRLMALKTKVKTPARDLKVGFEVEGTKEHELNSHLKRKGRQLVHREPGTNDPNHKMQLNHSVGSTTTYEGIRGYLQWRAVNCMAKREPFPWRSSMRSHRRGSPSWVHGWKSMVSHMVCCLVIN
jgi:hypothetical protein